MWELELSHASSVHSSARSDDEDGERSVVREGAEERGSARSLSAYLVPPTPSPTSGIKDLWSWGKTDNNNNNKKKNPSNMQESKFSSFRVYCRKRGKTDTLKFSRLRSWFSILLLGLHLLLCLCPLFVAVGLVVFWGLVLDRQLLQLLHHVLGRLCGKTVRRAVSMASSAIFTS